jgi:cytochrome c-type biogenesis protein CcmH
MNMSDRKHGYGVVFLGLAILTTLLLATPALAQQPTADQINAVAKNLSCPTCTGINVADCPTETCAQWRAQIGEMLAQGKSQQEILDYFAARYGDHVLQVPPKRGFFVWVWVLPILAILAGLGWLAYLMRVWLSQRATVPAESADISHGPGQDDVVEDEYLRRVQQDLEKLS